MSEEKPPLRRLPIQAATASRRTRFNGPPMAIGSAVETPTAKEVTTKRHFRICGGTNSQRPSFQEESLSALSLIAIPTPTNTPTTERPSGNSSPPTIPFVAKIPPGPCYAKICLGNPSSQSRRANIAWPIRASTKSIGVWESAS